MAGNIFYYQRDHLRLIETIFERIKLQIHTAPLELLVGGTDQQDCLEIKPVTGNISSVEIPVKIDGTGYCLAAFADNCSVYKDPQRDSPEFTVWYAGEPNEQRHTLLGSSPPSKNHSAETPWFVDKHTKTRYIFAPSLVVVGVGNLHSGEFHKVRIKYNKNYDESMTFAAALEAESQH